MAIIEKPITKAQLRDDIFNLGSTFDNVYLSDENNFTLKDMYDYLNSYFNEGKFSSYSKIEPTNNNINIWYDTTEIIK